MHKVDDTQRDLPVLIKQLAGDGARVAKAELSLARAEAAIIARQYVMGLAIGAVAFATAMAGITVLAQAAAILLVPFVTNPAYAYLSIGLAFIAITIILSLIAANLVTQKHEPVGAIFSWIMGHGGMK